MFAFMKLQNFNCFAASNLFGLRRKSSAVFSGFSDSNGGQVKKGSKWLEYSSREHSKPVQSLDDSVSKERDENQSVSDKKRRVINTPRITKPTRPVISSSIGIQLDKISSGMCLKSPEHYSAQTETLNHRTTSLAAVKFAAWRNQRHLKSFDISHKESVKVKEIKNYNYGLSGIGKVHHLKLKNPPAVAGEILYGLHSAVLAVAAGRRPFHKCYIQDTLLHSERPLMQKLKSLLKEKAIDIETCSKSVLTYLSQARPHQGVCLDVGPLNYETVDRETFESLLSERQKPQLFVVLDSVQDPVNLGAVIRSTYFLGVDQLFVVAKNSCSLTPVVSKCSAGAMEVCKIYAIQDLFEFLEIFCQKGWVLLGTSAAPECNNDKVVSLPNVSLEHNTILIIGNEGNGLAEAVKTQCHQLVTIPPGRMLHPLIDCLNVSVATGGAGRVNEEDENEKMTFFLLVRRGTRESCA